MGVMGVTRHSRLVVSLLALAIVVATGSLPAAGGPEVPGLRHKLR